MLYQGDLLGPVQALFDQVDDKGGRYFGLQSGEQDRQGGRGDGTLPKQPNNALRNARFQRCISLQTGFRPGYAFVVQSIETQKTGIRQAVGNLPRQPGLAAAQRADEEGDRL